MTVIDWDKNDILNYLGTYFPRSYAEAYCIYSELFKSSNSPLKDKDAIRIFDFCCGTGGEIVGFITALADNCKNIKNVLIDALDGNDYGLRLSESVMQEPKVKVQLTCGGRGCNIQNINQENLGKQPVILPPLSLQQSFAAKIEAIEKQKERISQSIKEVQTLFDSRMEVYFG